MADIQAARNALIVLIKAQRRGMSDAQRKKRKKPARWLYPWATEHHYATLYRAWVKPVREYVRDYIARHEEAVLRGDGAAKVVRRDAAAGESFALMVQSLNGWVNAYISNDEEKKLRSPIYMGLGNVAESAFSFNGNQYDKSVKSALGISFPSDEAWWSGARKLWQDTNHQIIRSDIQKYIADINSATEQAVVNGWSHKALAERIMALDAKITKSRANFIARDQIGKLNGTITQRRMQDIGLTMYEWGSSNDERVRESHAVMDGKLCRWDDATVYSEDGGKTWKPRPAGAVLMHPGMDYQCRCTAYAWFDELIDEADGVSPGEGYVEATELPTTELQPQKGNEPVETPEKAKRKAKKAGQSENSATEPKAEDLKVFYNVLLEDEAAVKADVRKITKEHQEFLAKYAKDMQGDFYFMRGAHYAPTKNRIRLNIKAPDERSTVLGYKTNMTTFLHEAGHWLDHNLLGKGKTIHGELPDLRKKLRIDVLNYCSNLLELDKPLKSVTELKALTGEKRMKILNDLCADLDMKNGVSDIFDGLTHHGLNNGYGHHKEVGEREYWQGDALECETIAHFFEARGTPKKLEVLRKYFPTSYQYFDDFIQGVGK